MNILRPLPKEELSNFFSEYSLKVIQYFMNTSLFAQPEVHKDKESLPIQIPKEHLEQWFVQALQVEAVGAGSYPIDILKKNEWGADVKMLSCKLLKDGSLGSSQSGETSLAQKFKLSGTNLDEAFKKKEFNAIITGWIDILYQKLNEVKQEQNIEKIYYFFFLRGTQTESYLCAFEVNIDLITNKVMTLKENKRAKESIYLNGLIDDKYGTGKIYKAKKRLELRLKPKSLLEDGFLLTVPTETPYKEDIYELVQDREKFDAFIKTKLQKFLSYTAL